MPAMDHFVGCHPRHLYHYHSRTLRLPAGNDLPLWWDIGLLISADKNDVLVFRKLAELVLPRKASAGGPAEVVIWPAASNDRRLVAVCSRCKKTIRSGFSSEAVSGPYNHECHATGS